MYMRDRVFYSLLRPFLCLTTNQFARKFKFLANLITYYERKKDRSYITIIKEFSGSLAALVHI